jgi:apolipoprotein N-acyltransferase
MSVDGSETPSPPQVRPSRSDAFGDAIGRFSDVIRTADGGRRMLLAFGAGLASVLAMAPFFLSPVLFLTIPILVWLLDRDVGAPSRRQMLWSAASVGWWFGFGYFAGGLFWVGEAFLVEADKFAWALPFAVTLLPAGLALFFAAATTVARLFWSRDASRVVVLAVALSIAEWLRGHILTGFPWNTIGYALTWPLTLLQSAGLMGVFALTLWVVIVAGLPLVMAGDLRSRTRQPLGRWTGLGLSLVMLGVLWGYGSYRLGEQPQSSIADVKMRIVQVSVPQREKWKSENQPKIFADHITYSLRNEAGVEDGAANITHIVWPEAAMPFLPLEHQEVLDHIGDKLGDETVLVTGALRRGASAEGVTGGPATGASGRPPVYNSLLVLGGDGRLQSIYDKVHLVPFGEYLPFQSTLEALGLRQLANLPGGFSAGPTPRPLLKLGKLDAVAGLICYEAIFPADVFDVRQRPQLYLNVTNDGWFGNTTGPRQHFHQARARAVETGVPLLRAANNGISAMIDAHGRAPQRLGLNAKGVLDTDVPGVLSATPYGRFGDWIYFLQLVLLILGIFLTRRFW